MKIAHFAVLVGVLSTLNVSSAFGLVSLDRRRRAPYLCASTGNDNPPSTSDDSEKADSIPSKLTEDEKKAVGNLVEDDEWNGLTMELAELVRLSIVEDLKKNTREFIGKDDYKIGDISKEVDARVKSEVANLRGKDEYELGDLVLAMDELAKDLTNDLTGKENYEVGDLSREIDKRIKSAVAKYCGEEEYEVGMLTKEVDRRVKERVAEFTGKSEYEFGDITREVDRRRQKWMKEYLGDDGFERYQFGDISKKALRDLTGKEDYQFGDVTKTIVGKLFAGKNKGGDKSS